MNRSVALLSIVMLIAVVGAVNADQRAPITPALMTPVQCAASGIPGLDSVKPPQDSVDLPLLTPGSSPRCVICNPDRFRDCDAACVQQGFLGGTCCSCSSVCLCSGQDPADVCPQFP